MVKRLLLLAIGACVALGLMTGCSGGEVPAEDTMLQDPAIDGGGVTDETTDPATTDPAAEETDAGADTETDAGTEEVVEPAE